MVLVDSVKIPLDSDNHLLQAAVTAAAAAATAFDSLEVTELLLPLLLPCLWYSSRTIILSRSEEPDKTLLKRCLLGGALNIVREAPEGMGDSGKNKKNLRNGINSFTLVRGVGMKISMVSNRSYLSI